jgi:hypothetical protein
MIAGCRATLGGFAANHRTGEDDMRMIAFTALAVTMVAMSSASAQEAARERCCKQMGGQWRTGTRLGYQANYYCYGLGGAGGSISNEYYKCVMGGGASKKK